ncbi:Kinetochore component CENP-S [Parasponia andersonii]|uniref:Kinetochore component CENP-S n=1 Tax=Parasponia andersonii TaxID=3476 RepID=A0A2P5D1R7_PARAD|nr:Kinetochore component CENP-S [Parasponia andersonii]
MEMEEDDSMSELLRDRFRLSTISIAEGEAKRNDMEVSETVVACIADLAFKYTEQLAKDLELFAQHASRKSVNMEDVILSAHRNEHLATSLRSLGDDLKAKEPQSERKRKKASKKEDKLKASTSVLDDLSVYLPKVLLEHWKSDSKFWNCSRKVVEATMVAASRITVVDHSASSVAG